MKHRDKTKLLQSRFWDNNYAPNSFSESILAFARLAWKIKPEKVWNSNNSKNTFLQKFYSARFKFIILLNNFVEMT